MQIFRLSVFFTRSQFKLVDFHRIQIRRGLRFDTVLPRFLVEFQLVPRSASLFGPFMQALRPGFGRTAFPAKGRESERYRADPNHGARDGEKCLERFAHFFSGLLKYCDADSHVRCSNYVMCVTRTSRRKQQRQYAASERRISF
ncbi:MAG TPA: hypothetical protein VHD34_10660 [Xanthobacteraceae bacterium]|nr:hypothetical protein [Xanthobacteraceae bacterium]